MVFKSICVLELWTKVASALEELTWYTVTESRGMKKAVRLLLHLLDNLFRIAVVYGIDMFGQS